MKGTTHKIREALGWTQTQLAEEFEIPIATVRNWDARGTCPGYIINMLYQIKAQKELIQEKNRKIMEMMEE